MSSTIADADLHVDIEALRAGCIGDKPVNVPGWHDAGEDYDEDSCYYEAVAAENDRLGETFVRIVKDRAVDALVVPSLGRSYEEYDFDEYVVDADEQDVAHLDDGEWDDMFAADYSVTDTGPAMNYWYPCHVVEDDPANAAYILRDTPVCVVERDGNWGLALTGGGMDLSWEIVEAYVRLNQLPPTHFCELPGMADRGRNARDHVLIRACLRSLDVASQHLRGTHDRLAERASSWSGTFKP